MEISEEEIQAIRDMYKEKGKEASEEDAYEAARNLRGFVELIWELAQKDAQRKRRLKKEPDGFPVDGQYSCLVCGNSINETTGWYSWYGQTCLICRKAINDGAIPAFICRERDSYFSKSSLNWKFKLKHPTVKKLIKEEKLKPRIILTEDGKPHEYIFLKKENPGLIERYSPERKSYDRKQKKLSKVRAREWKREMLQKYKKLTKKIKK
jgi:hypothetical protein